jgi:hypothetical protein
VHETICKNAAVRRQAIADDGQDLASVCMAPALIAIAELRANTARFLLSSKEKLCGDGVQDGGLS